MGGPDEDDAAAEDADSRPGHLLGVEDGCGCVELWEHLSDARRDGSTD